MKQISQKRIKIFTRFCRHHNTLLIQHNTKRINELKTQILETDELKAEIEALKKTTTPPTITPPATTSPSTKTPDVVMVRRKPAGNGNPVDYFDKTFAEYKEGFSANGESTHMEEKLGLALNLFTN